DIYCIIEEPYKHYFTEKVSYSHCSYIGLLVLLLMMISTTSLLLSYNVLIEQIIVLVKLFSNTNQSADSNSS
ncbi:hypothetical protein, partial [uncultured Eubacterium sp.]|uniref:hypothetical protein n=1 Tax=uncultured Eubacterium sp. TaxID=165185 RepID=UPI003263E4E1